MSLETYEIKLLKQNIIQNDINRAIDILAAIDNNSYFEEKFLILNKVVKIVLRPYRFLKFDS